MSGAHPKAIQTVMRHSSITLTMDTYGHLFPGHQTETVAKFDDVMTSANAARMTGTLDTGLRNYPPHKSQQLEHEAARTGMAERGDSNDPVEDGGVRKGLSQHKMREVVREDATPDRTAPPGTRTPDPLIKSQLPGIVTTNKQTTYDSTPTDPAYNPDSCSGNVPEDAELAAVIDAWPELPEAIRAGIMAMVQATVDAHGEQG